VQTILLGFGFFFARFVFLDTVEADPDAGLLDGKNFVDGSENAAIMYSFIETCKAQDVDPREWLTDVLSRISIYNNDYSLDLADLLPHNWKKARQCQSVSK
jgi:hypothetical protein